MNELRLTQEKNLFIEQLRGMAVLFVLIYHYTNRIPAMYMGSDIAPSVEFFTGKIGVYIFFIISGYLIAKTIRNSETLGEFYAKRLSRIWPLFILANTVIFIWLHYFPTPVVPEGPKDFDVTARTFWDYFGTLFFLEDFGFKWVDGVFWSILVELKYYLYIGIIALIFGKRYLHVFVWIAIILATVDFAVYLHMDVVGDDYVLLNRLLHGIVVAQYLPFFAIGMLLYHREVNLLLGICCVLASAQIIVAASLNPDFQITETIEFLTLFSVFLMFDRLVCKGQITRYVGEYSYSIYLFHQVIGFSLIMMFVPHMGIDMAIIVSFALVMALSVAGSWLAEWRFRRPLTRMLIQGFSMIGLTGKHAALHLKDDEDIEQNKGKVIPARSA